MGSTKPLALQGCAGQAAFGARSLSFSAPTSLPVAMAFNTLLYDPVQYSFLAVLKGLDAPETATMSFSSPVDAGGKPAFAAEHKPSSTLMTYASGGLQNVEPQATSFLRLVDEDKAEIFFKVLQTRVDAQVNTPCSVAYIVVTGIIPESEGSVPFKANGVKKSLLELQPLENPGGQGKAEGWQFRATFQALSTDFDFSTAP